MNILNNNADQLNQQNIGDKDPLVSKVSLIEERLNIGVRKVETGTVQINKKVISQEVTQEVPVTQEEVQVEHIQINQYIESAPTVRYEGDTTIIPVVKEVLVVEKRLMLVEELHITRKQITTTSTVNESLRREEIEINRINSAENNTQSTNQ